MSTEESPRYDFFLAHAASDTPLAEALYDLLAPHARPYLDSRSMRLGDDWDRSLLHAQRSSRVTVVLVSTQTPGAFYQREEIAFALDYSRSETGRHRVVPIYLDVDPSDDRTEVPYGLFLKRGITLSEPPDLQRAAQQLLDLLEDSGAAEKTSEDLEVSFTAPPRRRPPPQPPLHGRDVQLEKVGDIIDSLSAATPSGALRVPQLVLIGGPSGVGKSCFARHCLQVAYDRGFQCHSVVCEPFHEGMSFFPVREILRQVVTGGSVVDDISRCYGPHSTQVSMARIAESPDADPLQRRDALIATFVNLLFGRFRRHLQWNEMSRLAVFIDDLDRVDAGTADALLCFLSRAREAPVLVFGAFRTDLVGPKDHPLTAVRRAVGRSAGQGTEIRLEALSKEYIQDVTSAILGAECQLPWRFYEKLYSETEGNPLFVREILRSLSEGSGDLQLSEGVWRLKSAPTEWSVPRSVEGVIESRLDMLDGELRGDLEVAAVIGRRFAYEVISRLSEATDEELLTHLELLLDFDIIHELDDQDDTFEFSHGKIRDVLYNSMPRIRRKRVHARVAEILGNAQHTASEDWDALLGEHLSLAGHYSEAVPHLIAAARNSMSLGSAREAATLFSKAIASGIQAGFPDDEDLQHLTLEHIAALKLANDYDRALKACRELAESAQDERTRAWAFNHLGDIYWTRGQPVQALAAYSQSEALARRFGDETLLLECAADLHELHDREAERLAGLDPEAVESHRAAAQEYLDQQLILADRVNDARAKARAWRNQAKRERVAGNLDTALASYERAIALGDPNLPAHSIFISYSKTLRFAGRLDEARQIISRVLDWSTQSGSRRSMAIAYQYRGMIEMATTGKASQDAYSDLNRALELHSEIQYARGLRETYVLLGEWYSRSGDTTAAANMFRKAIGADATVSDQELLEVVLEQLLACGERARASELRSLWDRGE